MNIFFSPEMFAGLISLTCLEVILGIDNIIFISVLAAKLPAHMRERVSNTGLILAVVSRSVLLCGVFAITKLTHPLLCAAGHTFTGKDIILLLGGFFLIYKSTQEIHERLDKNQHIAKRVATTSVVATLVQIVLLDLVFSLDSVITAVGMASDLPVMIGAVIGGATVMLFFARAVNKIIADHPTIKMLALSFLMLVGLILIVDGCGHHIERSYLYCAIAFSIFVEMLNILSGSREKNESQSIIPALKNVRAALAGIAVSPQPQPALVAATLSDDAQLDLAIETDAISCVYQHGIRYNYFENSELTYSSSEWQIR